MLLPEDPLVGVGVALPDGGWISWLGSGEAGADAEVVLEEPWSAGVGVCGLALLVTGGAVVGRAGELGALCSVVGTGAAVVGDADGSCTVVVSGGSTVLGGGV